MTEFYTAAANGSLPNFTFLEPRISPSKNATTDPTYGLANHQHPTASVREGERWMKNVYESLRNGPKWNSTLLIITCVPGVLFRFALVSDVVVCVCVRLCVCVCVCVSVCGMNDAVQQ